MSFARFVWHSIARAAAFAALAIGALGCAGYRGTAVTPHRWLPSSEPGWIWVAGVPEVRQEGDKDCGAAALSAVLAYWGHPIAPQAIRGALHQPDGKGLRAEEITRFARRQGFDAYALRAEWTDVLSELRQGRPLIVGVAKRYGRDLLSHYEVVVGFHAASDQVLTLDPAQGFRQNARSGFLAEWEPTGRVAVVLFPVESESSTLFSVPPAVVFSSSSAGAATTSFVPTIVVATATASATAPPSIGTFATTAAAIPSNATSTRWQRYFIVPAS